jgi:malate dehydrogenase (oxaloacetate-decarboxylating)
MLDFKKFYNKTTGEEWLETSLTGKALLTFSQLNKGTAFSERERNEFGLKGKLPARIETLEEQVKRIHQQFHVFTDNLQKNIYLNVLHNTNQVLFYKVVKNHLNEMIPLIYTPIVSNRVKSHSREFRQPRGLYISINDKDHIEEILDNRSNPEIDLIAVTDGERVLGIGDQGIGAMDIPVAKLMIYTLCGAVDPNLALPILLDVGTNNQELLDDPLYLGLRQNRITGKPYDDFIKAFVDAVKRKFPHVFLHWEDFSREHAPRNLSRFRNEICSFNDDIQGTGVVALAALLAAIRVTHSTMTEQRIVVFGAGSAGTGVIHQICSAMVRNGLSLTEARKRFWLIDKPGLLTNRMEALTSEQQHYVRNFDETETWKVKDRNFITLEEVIAEVKPTILIGCAAVQNAFSKTAIQTMAHYVEQPIIFPLSNPTDKSEAIPEDLLNWTDGKALVAAGSPFEDVLYEGKKIRITQCNNAFAFPGIGLGSISIKAKKVSDNMLWAAAVALSNYSLTMKNDETSLLPSMDEVGNVAKHVALAVAKEAVRENLATVDNRTVEELIQENLWEPHYIPYRKSK